MQTSLDILTETFGADVAADVCTNPDGFDALDNTALLNLMRGEHGVALRNQFPTLRPWCSIMADTTQGLAINADGNVTTCCLDSSFQNHFANLHTDGIREVWRRYKDILLGDLYDKPYCADSCIGRGLSYSPSTVCNTRHLKEADWRAHPDLDFPLNVLLEPAAICNYACEGCPATVNTKHLADLDAIFENLKEGLPHIRMLALGLYGEPLLNRKLPDFLLRCREVAPQLVIQVLTNGTPMNEKVADKLVEAGVDIITLAIHAGPFTQNMLKYSVRGADYELVLKNLKYLTAARNDRHMSRTTIEVRTVLFNWNDTDELMNQLRQDVEDCGIVNGIPVVHRMADKLYWVLDVAAPHPRSSKRFVPGSKDLNDLKARGYMLA